MNKLGFYSTGLNSILMCNVWYYSLQWYIKIVNQNVEQFVVIPLILVPIEKIILESNSQDLPTLSKYTYIQAMSYLKQKGKKV